MPRADDDPNNPIAMWESIGRAKMGPLEGRVMDAVWATHAPVSVRSLLASFPGAAYTTIMTTVHRLHGKRMLTRVKRGRTFMYEAVMGRPQFDAAVATAAIATALDTHVPMEDALSLLSYVVDRVSDRDSTLLDALDALVQAKRASLG